MRPVQLVLNQLPTHFMNQMVLAHVRKTYEAEKYNHCWRIELDADGDMHELTFGRAGERISEQSEGAAAVVVYL